MFLVFSMEANAGDPLRYNQPLNMVNVVHNAQVKLVYVHVP